jgi:hypothetical protein
MAKDFPHVVLEALTARAENLLVPGKLSLALSDLRSFVRKGLRNDAQRHARLPAVARKTSGDEIIHVVTPALDNGFNVIDLKNSGRRRCPTVLARKLVALEHLKSDALG